MLYHITYLSSIALLSRLKIHSKDFLNLMAFCAMHASLDTTRQEKLPFYSSGEKPVTVECVILLFHNLKVEFQGNTCRVTDRMIDRQPNCLALTHA